VSQLASNAKWLAVAQLGKVAIQLVSMTVLARLLEPRYYGVLAIANSVIAFAMLFRDLGTTAALIQTRDLTEETKSTAFWISVSMGSALFLIMLALAYPASRYYQEPELMWVLVITSLIFPITAISAVPATLLERSGRFREIAVAEVAAQLLGLITAVTMALAGAGVYSLAVPGVLSSILTTSWVYKLQPWRPKAKASRASMRAMAGFSANLTGFNLINYFSRNADTLIIGKLLGAAMLGIYSTAMKLMLFPLQSITYVSNRALFPVLSQLQSDDEQFGKLYLDTVHVVSLFTFPMMAGLWICSDVFVHAVYGERWLPMINVITWLAPVGLIQSINSTTGTVFMAKGRTDLLLRIGIFSSVLQVGAFALGAQHGLVAVAALYLVANVLSAVPSFALVMRLARIHHKQGASALWPALAASALMVGSCWLMARATSGALAHWPQLIAMMAVGGLTYVIAIRALFPRSWEVLLSSARRRGATN
jgi:O-antigen/teichoic acid export membrane protein